MRALEGLGTWRGITGEMMLDVADALELEPTIAARVALVVVKLQASIRARAGRKEFGKILQKHYMELEEADRARERARFEEGLALLDRVNTERELMDARLLQEASKHAASLGDMRRGPPGPDGHQAGAHRATSFRDAMIASKAGPSGVPFELGDMATPVEADSDEEEA